MAITPAPVRIISIIRTFINDPRRPTSNWNYDDLFGDGFINYIGDRHSHFINLSSSGFSCYMSPRGNVYHIRGRGIRARGSFLTHYLIVGRFIYLTSYLQIIFLLNSVHWWQAIRRSARIFLRGRIVIVMNSDAITA